MNRNDCLKTAADIVCKDREDTYGKLEDNFAMIAKLWSDYLITHITPDDVPVLMILLKVARVGSGNFKADNFVDIAGYAACACEIGSSSPVEKMKEGV